MGWQARRGGRSSQLTIRSHVFKPRCADACCPYVVTKVPTLRWQHGNAGYPKPKTHTQTLMETLKIELHFDGDRAKFLLVGVARSELVFSRLCDKTPVTATFVWFC